MSTQNIKPTIESERSIVELYHTLHDFMLHTESVVYIIMGISLFGVLWFWFFLNEKR